MFEFEIARSDRHCSVTDKELQPGDYFYSVIINDGDEYQRVDISDAAWKGPPDDCVGWWRTQVPTLATLRMKWAPNDVMVHYFESLADDPAKRDTRFILSLLMLRRRLFSQREIETNPDGSEEIIYDCSRNNKEYRVTVVELSENRMEQVQNELAELLYCPGKK